MLKICTEAAAKPRKWRVPSEDSDQLVHPRRVITPGLRCPYEEALGLGYLQSAFRRHRSKRGCAGWSEYSIVRIPFCGVSAPRFIFLRNSVSSDSYWFGDKDHSEPRQANLVLIAYSSSEASGEPPHPRSLPEPSLLAHTSSESIGTFRQKARSLAPLNGWACAVKICHDGMLEDTNSLDGAHSEPRQAKMCLRKFAIG